MNHISFNTLKIWCFILLLAILSVGCKKDKSTKPMQQLNNWQTIYQNNDLDLYSIKFLDKNNGYVLATISGLHGISDWVFLLSTVDGGNTWNRATCFSYDTIHAFPLYDIGKIFPLSKNVLLSIGYHVHKSNDIGKTWIDVSPQFVGSSINDLHIIDSTTWLVASGNHIFRTTNAGQTWQTVFQTDFMGAFDLFSFPSPAIGYANIGVVDLDHGGSVGLIVKTTDGGQSWTIMKPEPWKSNNISIPYMCALQFITEQTGYISTRDYKLYKTVDGGNNWSLVHNNNNTLGLEYFISENVGYYSDGVTVWVTNDGGQNWKVDNYNPAANSDILTWTFSETGQGYALTRDHRIIRKINY